MFHDTTSTADQWRVESRESRVERRTQRFGLRSHSGTRLSALDPRLFRPGISLTEVLIAMGILTIGLLGVASIFPVASFYMQQGEVADRASAIAQAAFNNAVTSGQLDPANWWMMTPSSAEPYKMSVDGPSLPQSFSRPVLSAIEECKAVWPANVYCQRMGGVYVIDPLGAAAMTDYGSGAVSNVVARAAPASSALVNPRASYYGPQWDTWIRSAPNNEPKIWPIRRLTFRQNRMGAPANANYFLKTQPLTRSLAERQFMTNDDLAMDIPTQADRPSKLAMNSTVASGTTTPLARQSRGDYSWIITVVPRDLRSIVGAVAEVSVVVFYKRVVESSPAADVQGMQDAALHERLTKASIVSTGLSGGEVLVEPIDDGLTESPFQNLKKGRWVMLCGPHPNSTTAHPKFVSRWYRVLSIEDADTGRKLLSLRGPQWPWQPSTIGPNELSNNLCVGIFPGAVAVHSKTVKLESNSSWSIQ